MTCIVSFKDDDKILFGSDGCFSSDDSIYSMKIDKIFKIDGELVGVCGDIKIINAIKSLFRFPSRDSKSLLEYTMITIPLALKDILEVAGCLIQSPEGKDESFDGGVIFTYEDEVYIIEENLGCWSSKDRYNAVGSGSNYAIGALSAIEDIELDAKTRVKKALQVSSKHCGSVSPPFKFLTKSV
jgi:ATP-dependent protease HslVU (ClpYQ) peptidase subunit